jgi:truncated hemoglobin YjbI
MDSFKVFHEALKKTAKEEQKFLKDFFGGDKWRGGEDEAEDEPELEDENVDKE